MKAFTKGICIFSMLVCYLIFSTNAFGFLKKMTFKIENNTEISREVHCFVKHLGGVALGTLFTVNVAPRQTTTKNVDYIVVGLAAFGCSYKPGRGGYHNPVGGHRGSPAIIKSETYGYSNDAYLLSTDVGKFTLDIYDDKRLTETVGSLSSH